MQHNYPENSKENLENNEIQLKLSKNRTKITKDT